MLVMAALVGGGVVYAGVSAYHKYRRRRTPVWLIENGDYVKSDAELVADLDLNQLERRVNLNFNLATISMGLTAIGVLFYEPLVLIALPFNIFDAVMMFEDTWTALLEQGRTWVVVGASSVVVAITLLAHQHLLASVLEWLYFLNQKFSLVVARAYAEWTRQGTWQPQVVIEL